jgi:hypothetical protein
VVWLTAYQRMITARQGKLRAMTEAKAILTKASAAH